MAFRSSFRFVCSMGVTGLAFLALAPLGTAAAQTQPPPAAPGNQAPAGYGGSNDPYAQQPPAGYAPPAGYPQNAYPPPNNYPPPNGYPPPTGYPNGAPPPNQPAPQGGYPPGSYPPPGYAPPPAYAPPPPGYIPAIPGYRQHDGFYFNVRLGIGYLSASASDYKYSGGGASGGIALGGALSRNLVLFGEIYGVDVANPNFTANGQTVSTTNANLSLGAFGVGAAYYFDPVNAFALASLGLGKMTFSYDDLDGSHSDDSNWGFMARLAGGKEWWVSSEWALGAAVETGFGHMSVPQAEAITAFELSLLFSVTCN